MTRWLHCIHCLTHSWLQQSKWFHLGSLVCSLWASSSKHASGNRSHDTCQWCHILLHRKMAILSHDVHTLSDATNCMYVRKKVRSMLDVVLVIGYLCECHMPYVEICTKIDMQETNLNKYADNIGYICMVLSPPVVASMAWIALNRLQWLRV